MIPTRPQWHIAVLILPALLAVVLLAVRQGLGWSLLTPHQEDTFLPTQLQKHKSPASDYSDSAADIISDRHHEEKKRLLQRLGRSKNGELKPHSPRYRLLTALHGFYRYQKTSRDELGRIKERYRTNVSKKQRQLIESTIKYESKIQKTEALIGENDRVAQSIVDHALDFYGIDFTELSRFVREAERDGKTAERVSVSQAFKHYVRDWAVEGEYERTPTFPQILETLDLHFPRRNDEDRERPVRVLVPGSGVGRLAHDIAALGGFEVTANEWSSYMNLAYRYLASPKTSQPNSTSIYPFIDWWSHQPTTEELHRPVTFPDVAVDPSSVVLVEGDFTTAFNRHGTDGAFDAVVTLFFIDTARNVLSYLETIHRLLKPGGIWINLGPLLYGSAPFLQPSLDEILGLCHAVGFEFLETDPRYGNLTLSAEGKETTVRQKEAPYGFNERTLWKNAYWAQFWVARRE